MAWMIVGGIIATLAWAHSPKPHRRRWHHRARWAGQVAVVSVAVLIVLVTVAGSGMR
jgi:hypothetical protein